MDNLTDDTIIDVLAPIRQTEGDETIIGSADTAVYLVLPNEAVEILDDLAAGLTVRQAKEAYAERHGELPDMEDFLSLLEGKGLVRVKSSDSISLPSRSGTPNNRPAKVRYHFENIPQNLAARIFSLPTLVICWGIIVAGLVLVLVDSSLLPGWKAFYFSEHLTLSMLGVMAMYYTAIFLHEMAHLLAARAVGVNSRLGIGHRLWTLVAETDMSGLWGIPRRQRYLPLLAGPLVDATSAAMLIGLLSAHRHGWVSLSHGVVAFSRALLLIYLLLLLWQCFFFVRTDFYYAIANFFNCKNLLSDTESYLKSRVSRGLLGRAFRRSDLSHIPADEMKVVRVYAWVWIIGRAGAMSALVFIHIPLMVNYLLLVSGTLSAGFQGNGYAYLDSLFVSTLAVLPVGVGFYLWIRSLVGSWARRREQAVS